MFHQFKQLHLSVIFGVCSSFFWLADAGGRMGGTTQIGTKCVCVCRPFSILICSVCKMEFQWKSNRILKQSTGIVAAKRPQAQHSFSLLAGQRRRVVLNERVSYDRWQSRPHSIYFAKFANILLAHLCRNRNAEGGGGERRETKKPGTFFHQLCRFDASSVRFRSFAIKLFCIAGRQNLTKQIFCVQAIARITNFTWISLESRFSCLILLTFRFNAAAFNDPKWDAAGNYTRNVMKSIFVV